MASRFLKCCVLLQKHRTPLLITSCGGVFAANLFHHVFPDMSFRPFYQAWHKREQATLSEKLEDVFQQLLLVSLGFLQGPKSASRKTLTAQPTTQTESPTAQFSQKVDWSSDAGSALKEALVFSLEAQKFAIAREVAHLESGGPFLTAAVAPICLGVFWACSVALEQMLRLHIGHPFDRAILNMLALVPGVVFYFLLSEAVNHWVDFSSDRRAAAVSRDYAKGGLEFYDKILSRNRTLRSLMGQKGKDMYAPNGNLFPHPLQLRHTSYTSRREGILTMLKNDKV